MRRLLIVEIFLELPASHHAAAIRKRHVVERAVDRESFSRRRLHHRNIRGLLRRHGGRRAVCRGSGRTRGRLGPEQRWLTRGDSASAEAEPAE